VGAGGIVSTAYCILFKLFTLKLTRKQLNGLLNSKDNPFARGIGFIYIRYTQPPKDLWEWYEEYLDDEEEIDVKAGGGHSMTVGDMIKHFLTKLEWYSTLFPRIPVPVQKEIKQKLSEYEASFAPEEPTKRIPDEEVNWGEAERQSRLRSTSRDRERPRPTGLASARVGGRDKGSYGDREKPSYDSREKSAYRDRSDTEHRSRDFADELASIKQKQDKYRVDDGGRDRDRDRDRHKEKDYRRDRDYDRGDKYRSRDHDDRSSRKYTSDSRDRHRHRSRSRDRERDRRRR